jgi:hypothetical protein
MIYVNRGDAMRAWTLKEASDNFDELLDAALISPQKIIDGDREFVMVSGEEWERILARNPEAALASE